MPTLLFFDKEAARLIETVDLPTPPFALATAIIFLIFLIFPVCSLSSLMFEFKI